jgi:hypothetical protein
MRFYLSLYFFIAAIYLLSASGRMGISDSTSMFNVSQSIVTDGSFRSEPCDPQYEDHLNHCVPGKGGHYYAGFGLVPSLLVTPAVLAGKHVTVAGHVGSSQIPKVLVSVFTALFAPLACLVLAMWIVELGYSKRTAVIAACILGFASSYWYFGVKGFYSEPYFTLFLLLAAYLLSLRDFSGAVGLSGLAFGVACGARINGAMLGPAFIVAIALQVRARGWTLARFVRDAAFFSAAFSVCALLIGWANYTRFGSPLKTGYHLAFPTTSALLSTPWSEGIPSLLLSGEVGLLIFAPWLVIAVICFPRFARRHLPEATLCAAVFILNFFFFAKYNSWHGGWVVGPRLLVPTFPFLIMAMAAGLERRLPATAEEKSWKVLRPLAAALLAGAFFIQVLGVFYPTDRYYALKEFYEHRAVKPWWLGSIPLASIDFLYKPKLAALPEPTDPNRPAAPHSQLDPYKSVDPTMSEDKFLTSFPDSENLTLSNLMLLKLKLLGFPASAFYAYLLFLIGLGATGLIGLRRYAVP